MKKLITALLCAFTFVCTSAQTGLNSVKVKLVTSQGAEIGIDGDVSSTNVLTKKVATGKHTVVVNYGASFSREYEIEVTRDETFEFSLDGKLRINSQPSGRKVYIDGIAQGKTPFETTLVGDHNIRIEGDYNDYYDFDTRISLKPFENLEEHYELKKRPPHTYGFLMVNYNGVIPGMFLGLCKRWGFYLRGACNFNDDYDGTWSDDIYPRTYRKDGKSYMLGAGGFMLRCHKHVYAYLGGGYGEYLKLLKHEGDYEARALYGSKSGAVADVGVILKYKALLLSGGYTRFFGSNSGKAYQELNIGLGITLHKRKKSNK